MPRLVKILTTTALIGVLTYLLGWSPVFTTKRVEYNGITDLLQISAVEKKVGDLTGTKLARLEPRQIVSSLKEISWVADADVSRNWLKSSVIISVKPRVPIGTFGSQYIDASGAMFDSIGPTVDLPVVSAPNPHIGLAAVELFAALPLDFRQNVTSLMARKDDDFTMAIHIAQRKLTLRFGNAEEIDLKVRVFKALVALEENKNVSTIDVSAPHAPIVK
jgi:cell division septal protein FtsQ